MYVCMYVRAGFNVVDSEWKEQKAEKKIKHLETSERLWNERQLNFWFTFHTSTNVPGLEQGTSQMIAW